MEPPKVKKRKTNKSVLLKMAKKRTVSEFHSEQNSNSAIRKSEIKQYKRSLGLMGYGMNDFDADDSLCTDKSQSIDNGYLSE